MQLIDKSSRSGKAVLAILALAGMGILEGCSNPPVSAQARLSQPGLVFSDSPALVDEGSLLSNVEPGTDDRGGAAASGCTACR